MAVFHYCAQTQRDGRTDILDGMFFNDAKPEHMDSEWMQALREKIAGDFWPPAKPRWVQITSLTRIGG